MPCPIVGESVLAEAQGIDVAVAIEDREGVAVFEHPGAVVDPARRGEDVEAVGYLDDVGHAVPPALTSPRPLSAA